MTSGLFCCVDTKLKLKNYLHCEGAQNEREIEGRWEHATIEVVVVQGHCDDMKTAVTTKGRHA